MCALTRAVSMNVSIALRRRCAATSGHMPRGILADLTNTCRARARTLTGSWVSSHIFLGVFSDTERKLGIITTPWLCQQARKERITAFDQQQDTHTDHAKRLFKRNVVGVVSAFAAAAQATKNNRAMLRSVRQLPRVFNQYKAQEPFGHVTMRCIGWRWRAPWHKTRCCLSPFATFRPDGPRDFFSWWSHRPWRGLRICSFFFLCCDFSLCKGCQSEYRCDRIVSCRGRPISLPPELATPPGPHPPLRLACSWLPSTTNPGTNSDPL